MWVIQCCYCTSLALEALVELLGGEFDDRAVQAGVASLVYLSHAAGADGCEDLVVAQACPRGKEHNGLILPHPISEEAAALSQFTE
jgi:hypothetical protein